MEGDAGWPVEDTDAIAGLDGGGQVDAAAVHIVLEIELAGIGGRFEAAQDAVHLDAVQRADMDGRLRDLDANDALRWCPASGFGLVLVDSHVEAAGRFGELVIAEQPAFAGFAVDIADDGSANSGRIRLRANQKSGIVGIGGVEIFQSEHSQPDT